MWRFLLIYGVLLWGTLSGALFLVGWYLWQGHWPQAWLGALVFGLWWTGGVVWGWRMWRWLQRRQQEAAAHRTE